MSEIEILKRNPNKLARLLSCVLPQAEQEKIIKVGHDHSKKLMQLSRQQLIFAKSIKNKQAWRQKISRGYYACYNASKALRLASSGHYSQEAKDHQKIADLPNSFNKKPFWENFLTQFRSDRNLADYDHLKQARDLEYTPKEYLSYAEEFYSEVKKYLQDEEIL